MSLLHASVNTHSFLPERGGFYSFYCAFAVLVHHKQTQFTYCTLISALPFAVVYVALKLRFIDLYLQDIFIII